ncbi:MAG: hypothetical protein ABS49_06945 [Erythrobacter sp. SCN 62-14]|nr:MAG: hypothetical protein ABS49_06945 [Erythrobacter sp. SCN 62-14]
MPDSTRDSDRILREAKTSLVVQREGGTHRGATSIGKGSAELKMKSLLRRAGYFGAALVAILTATLVAGLVLDGIGFWGVVTAFFAVVAAGVIFANYPKVKTPKRADLAQGSPAQMVARTELWLEAQRASLPPAAVRVIDQMGVQLDALGVQLQNIDPAHPAAAEVRELVGEYIPETIENYHRIPANLRAEAHIGKSADERLIDSLTKLSGELDRVTRRLAEGALDDLAVKTRYLEYRYGGVNALDGLGAPDSGVPLPDFSVTPAKQER